MTADTFRLFVPGTPAPMGSKKFMGTSNAGKGILVESSKRVRPWRDLVVTMCVDKINAGEPTFVGPVDVTMTFAFNRPKGHFGTGRNAGLLKDAAPMYPRTIGDLDKLERACCDAIGAKHGAGVIADDADVVYLVGRKVYATDAMPVGCYLTISPAIP